MGVASGCGQQEVGVASGSGWNLWLWLLGVVVRRYIDFFAATSLLFVYFLFFVLVPVLFVIKFYVLNNFLAQYKHTYGRLRASHGSHMKAAHIVLYTKKHTQTYASFTAMDINGNSMTLRSVV